MYSIEKVTNNINDRYHYTVSLPYRTFWRAIAQKYEYDYLIDREFATMIHALEWILRDMRTKSFKSTSTRVLNDINSIEQVIELINKEHEAVRVASAKNDSTTVTDNTNPQTNQ